MENMKNMQKKVISCMEQTMVRNGGLHRGTQLNEVFKFIKQRKLQ